MRATQVKRARDLRHLIGWCRAGAKAAGRGVLMANIYCAEYPDPASAAVLNDTKPRIG